MMLVATLLWVACRAMGVRAERLLLRRLLLRVPDLRGLGAPLSSAPMSWKMLDRLREAAAAADGATGDGVAAGSGARGISDAGAAGRSEDLRVESDV